MAYRGHRLEGGFTVGTSSASHRLPMIAPYVAAVRGAKAGGQVARICRSFVA
jgi:hypothetical protein